MTKQTTTAIIDDDDGPRRVHVFGRDGWALRKLIEAGDREVTPLDTPGPRWSGYIFKLRKAGIPVATLNERHGGAFPGTHARYRLTAAVEITGQGATV